MSRNELMEISGQYNSKDYYYRDLKIGRAWWDGGGYSVWFKLTDLKKKDKLDSYDDCYEWLESRIEWLIEYLQD